ncbi:MAG: hypothetical protein R3F55_18185 [Alphaproteobacteria bacterium]
MRVTMIGLAVIAAGVASCVPVGPGSFGPTYATGQQIYNTVTNFSVNGALNNGAAYCEYHGPTGQLMGRDGQGNYQGSWAVAGNQICYTIPQRNAFNNCQNVIFQGQRATFYDAGGGVVASGNLLGGNIC